MGKHKQITCEYCSKTMRSDNLKRHLLKCSVHNSTLKKSIEHSSPTKSVEHSTPKKKKILKVKVNRSPKKKNKFVVTEADHSGSSDSDQLDEETEEDRAFINNDEIEDDSFDQLLYGNPYLDKDEEPLSEEAQKRVQELFEKDIDKRLAELGSPGNPANYADTTACIFCQTLYFDWTIKEHMEKECKRRLVDCYWCNKKIMYQELSTHVPPCRLNVKMNRKKKIKEKKKEKKNKWTELKKKQDQGVKNFINKHMKGRKEQVNKTNKKQKKVKDKREKDKNTTKKTKKKVQKGKGKKEKEKKQKEKKKGKGKKDKKKKRERKSTQFKLQKHGALKYKICKKLFERTVREVSEDVEEVSIVFPDWIKQFVIGNEFGSGPKPKPHCHAVLITKKPMTFKQLKMKIKEKTGFKFNDVQSCKNIKTEVHYVGKEDYRPMNYNFDWDLMHINVRAYIHAQKYTKLSPANYPYCALPPWQKKDFKEKFLLFRSWENETESQVHCPEDLLRPWQKQVVNTIKHKCQNDRQILWIVDSKGNSGKSYLSKYLRLHHGAFSINGDSLKMSDFAFSYDGQEIVVIDFPRHVEADSMNYGIMEALKNGSLFSSKYESRVLDFKSVHVVCMSNIEPNYSKLSPDRWQSMFTIDENDNKLKRFQPQLPEYPSLTIQAKKTS